MALVQEISELQARESIKVWRRLLVKIWAIKDARTYLGIDEKKHTFRTKYMQATCYSKQDAIVSLVAKLNEDLRADRANQKKRLEFKERHLEILKTQVGKSARERASLEAQKSNTEGKILDLLALIAVADEAIYANNKQAQSALSSWESYFKQQAGWYLETLHAVGGKMLKRPPLKGPATVKLPDFEPNFKYKCDIADADFLKIQDGEKD